MYGNHKTTWRHYRYLNDLGFDCVTFDLLFGSNKLTYKDLHPEMRFGYKGVFYVWTRQIRSILDHLPGDKIIYAFSGPSLSAFWASDNRSDVIKLICDGGPFHDIYKNSRNFFYHELNVKNPTLNKISSFLGSAIWGIGPLQKLHNVLENWNSEIPILSIRGIEDNIVDIKSIRSVFEPHEKLDLKILELDKGKHLDGMRDFSDLYTSTISPFLIQDLEIQS